MAFLGFMKFKFLYILFFIQLASHSWAAGLKPEVCQTLLLTRAQKIDIPFTEWKDRLIEESARLNAGDKNPKQIHSPLLSQELQVALETLKEKILANSYRRDSAANQFINRMFKKVQNKLDSAVQDEKVTQGFVANFGHHISALAEVNLALIQ